MRAISVERCGSSPSQDPADACEEQVAVRQGSGLFVPAADRLVPVPNPVLRLAAKHSSERAAKAVLMDARG